MKHEISHGKGHIRPEEFKATFEGLMEKLVDSRAIVHPSAFSALAEFIHLSATEYTPKDHVQERIKEIIEKRITYVISRQDNDECGKFKPFSGIDGLCQWGIIAKYLGINYDLTPESLEKHPLITDKTNRDLRLILNFEFHHFDYEGELESRGDFMPLDLIYFCELNRISEFLEGRVLGDLEQMCIMPEIRKATPEESTQRLQQMKQELEQRKREGYETRQDQELIELLENELNGKKNEGVTYIGHWENSEGVILCYPDITSSVIPRQPHSTQEVKDYLGKKLEGVLKTYCDEECFDLATQILYRRNRVKGFIGQDIKIPKQLVEQDDTTFSTLDPQEIRMWLDNMVTVFGPHDIGSELFLPTNLKPQEYRLYRTINEAMEYIRKGVLTYDTEEKRQLLVNSQPPTLDGSINALLLPGPSQL